jgi:acyl CoA:acetate/3-ketoacid CoA transferase beta subunit/acyl CoA:acetate/3-ketoacid CoA transferase alpha subunit
MQWVRKEKIVMEETGKIMALKDAISNFIHKKMSIHVSDYFSYPTAPLMELTRQHWGLDSQFTLITGGIHTTEVPLLIGGCVKKVIHTFAGDIYPTPGPNPVFQGLFNQGRVEYERWSMLSLCMRLAAGAMNVGYLPIRSLNGSDMEVENPHAFRVMQDPFGEGESMGVVKALCPDITLIHGIMADKHGNTILAPISITGIQGALASKEGAIVTVERIVPTEVLKKYSHLVDIPGHMVKSVSEARFGAHPWSLITPGIQEVTGYDYDYELLAMGRKATEDTKNLDKFVKHWILDSKDHEAYLSKVGMHHLDGLKKQYQRVIEEGVKSIEIKPTNNEPVSFSPQEIRIYAVTMKISEIIRKKGYPLITGGIGVGNMAACIAKELLKRENIHSELAVDLGIVGYEPQAGDPFILNLRNIFAATILTGATDFYSKFCQKGRKRMLGVLGGGQIDRYGNLNSTFLPPNIFLPGSGGANDVASYSDEVLVTMPQSKRRLVDRVPYITCSGQNVRTLITDLGVFEKMGIENEFMLTEYFCIPEGKGEREYVAEIQKKCGWELKVAAALKPVKTAPRIFMDVLDAYDPQHVFRKGSYG